MNMAIIFFFQKRGMCVRFKLPSRAAFPTRRRAALGFCSPARSADHRTQRFCPLLAPPRSHLLSLPMPYSGPGWLPSSKAGGPCQAQAICWIEGTAKDCG